MVYTVFEKSATGTALKKERIILQQPYPFLPWLWLCFEPVQIQECVRSN